MTTRSTLVKFNNLTDKKLTLTHSALSHGVWTADSYPPHTISAQGSASWQSESDGFATGTQGTATYYLDGVGNVTVSWDNPFVGSNSYGQSAPKDYSISHSGGGGNNAEVTFTLVSS